MLRLTRIEEGACYATDSAKLYIAWSMLLNSSKLFWGCEIIRSLDDAKSLSDQAFGGKYEKFPDLWELLKNFESPVLDAVRIVICFENYFKAKLLLGGYVIHQMDLGICRQHYTQFITGNARKMLLQKISPILINDVMQAEKPIDADTKPLLTLTKQTLGISTLMGQPKYQEVYLRDQTSEDQEIFPILERLNGTRNSLHFLNVEYIASGGLSINSFVVLRDYVTQHLDTLANKIEDESTWELEIGKSEIEHLLDIELGES